MTPRPPDRLNAEIARRAFRFFIDETDPRTGLTKDRAALNGGDNYTVASIAATGYALTALPIGVENGWISRADARRRALVTLRFLENRMPQVHGWFYHFVDMRTGERVWKCELSSIDTALLLAGVMGVGQYWPHSGLSRRAERLLSRVDWSWMLTDGGAKPAELTLCMGWKPESGFLQSRWSSYCELMLLYLQGLGAPRHPLPAASWAAWKREVERNEGFDVIAPGPIFMHQMTQGYVDLRNQRDGLGYDYWQNSVNAHRANAAFCARHEAEFASYRGGIWGLNASDTPDGYGTREPSDDRHDGTICPTGAVAGLPFVPDLSRRAIAAMYDRYSTHIWGRYGFADAYNADKNWWDPDVIGIDLGMALVSLEDARSGFVWRLMGHSLILRRGLRAAGFHRTHEAPPRPVLLRPVANKKRLRTELRKRERTRRRGKARFALSRTFALSQFPAGISHFRVLLHSCAPRSRETRRGPGADCLRGVAGTTTATADCMMRRKLLLFHEGQELARNLVRVCRVLAGGRESRGAFPV